MPVVLRSRPLKKNTGGFLTLTYTNPGTVCVLEELAPLCAQDILTRVGIGTTKFFASSSSAASGSSATGSTSGASGSTSRRSGLTPKIRNRRPSFSTFKNLWRQEIDKREGYNGHVNLCISKCRKDRVFCARMILLI